MQGSWGHFELSLANWSRELNARTWQRSGSGVLKPTGPLPEVLGKYHCGSTEKGGVAHSTGQTHMAVDHIGLGPRVALIPVFSLLPLLFFWFLG